MQPGKISISNPLGGYSGVPKILPKRTYTGFTWTQDWTYTVYRFYPNNQMTGYTLEPALSDPSPAPDSPDRPLPLLQTLGDSVPLHLGGAGAKL